MYAINSWQTRVAFPLLSASYETVRFGSRLDSSLGKGSGISAEPGSLVGHSLLIYIIASTH